MGIKKNIVSISSWVIVCIGLLTMLGFVGAEQKQRSFTALHVNINTENGNFFILEEDIEQMVYDLGYTPDVISISQVDIKQLEDKLKENPSIRDANVFADIDGTVQIDIEQRNPIIRVFNQSGESYYIDEEGWLMPLSSKYTSRVLVATGHLNEPFVLRNHASAATQSQDEENEDAHLLQDLYQLAVFVNNDPFWKAQIIQVDVNERQEFELIPRVGSHRIILGSIDHMETKFAKLKVFYEEGLEKTGWNEFGVINLKYKNQVVCSK